MDAGVNYNSSGINVLNNFYVSYNGERVSFRDLVNRAENGEIDLCNNKILGKQMSVAFKEMIEQSCKTIIRSGHTLYSQDEEYIVVKSENGEVVKLISTRMKNGLHIRAIATMIAKGKSEKEIGIEAIEFIKKLDLELYNKAVEISRIAV